MHTVEDMDRPVVRTVRKTENKQQQQQQQQEQQQLQQQQAKCEGWLIRAVH